MQCLESKANAITRAVPGLLLAVAMMTAGGCGSGGTDAAVASSRQAAAATPVERGRYLVEVAGCHDCHTALKMGPHGPERDRSMLLAGHPAALSLPPPPSLGDGPWGWVGTLSMTAFAGPWGVSYAANLTPHDSGLGVWTEAMFIQAMRTGKHMGSGRPILPPMPVANVGLLHDDDLKAVFAYLRSLPPVENVVPDPQAPAMAAR